MEGGEEKEERRRKRKSKDKKMNREIASRFFGREGGWGNLFGSKKEDEQGEYTFTEGARNTVIDYVMGDEEVREKIWGMRVKDKIDSDPHHPLVIILKGEERKERREGERKDRIKRGIWNGMKGGRE